MDDRYLTTEQAAAILGITPADIYHLTAPSVTGCKKWAGMKILPACRPHRWSDADIPLIGVLHQLVKAGAPYDVLVRVRTEWRPHVPGELLRVDEFGNATTCESWSARWFVRVPSRVAA